MKLLTTPAHGRLSVTCLHTSVVGHFTHFIAGRTQPHLVFPELCEGCQQGQGVRWIGFVGVVVHGSRATRILQIPAGAYRHCGALQARQGQLRGRVLTLSRMGENGKRNAPVKVVMFKEYDNLPLPDAFDLNAALERIWGMRPGTVATMMEATDGDDYFDPQRFGGEVEE